METITIEATVDTPAIVLDPTNNIFEISGKSYPEDTKEFYGPILQWMDRYVLSPNAETTLVIKLKYFNSSSYKPIFDILTKLESIGNAKVNIQWFYKTGDTDMKESGEEFSELVDLNFSFHSF
ncbi:MAG: DUF1987 domain-containing protein [Bacteroidia bacterium]